MLILNGSPVVEQYKEKISEILKTLDKKLRLVIIETHKEGCQSAFIREKIRMAKELGIAVECRIFEGEKKDFRKWLNIFVHQDKVSGLVIQLPLKSDLSSQTQYLLETIPERKDIDCLTEKCIGRLVTGRMIILPPVVEALFSLLKYYKISLINKNVVVIGRGKLVGRPIVNALMNTNANIINLEISDVNLSSMIKLGDVVITGIGKPDKFKLKKDMIKSGATLIDFGWGKINGKINGDVDIESVKDRAYAATPVPGGIGRVTVAALLYNLVKINTILR